MDKKNKMLLHQNYLKIKIENFIYQLNKKEKISLKS